MNLTYQLKILLSKEGSIKKQTICSVHADEPALLGVMALIIICVLYIFSIESPLHVTQNSNLSVKDKWLEKFHIIPECISQQFKGSFVHLGTLPSENMPQDVKAFGQLLYMMS